jgi:hypothetical protein
MSYKKDFTKNQITKKINCKIKKSKMNNLMVLGKVQIGGVFIARALKSICMIYTFGLMISLAGTAQYFSETIQKGNYAKTNS